MFELIINYWTIMSYALYSFDVTMQIIKIYKRKSSLDISITWLSIRILAWLLIISKFILVNDIYLMIWQAIFMTFLIVYIFVVIYYRFDKFKN